MSTGLLQDDDLPDQQASRCLGQLGQQANEGLIALDLRIGPLSWAAFESALLSLCGLQLPGVCGLECRGVRAILLPQSNHYSTGY